MGQGEALAHGHIRRQQHLVGEQVGLVVGEILRRALADGQDDGGTSGSVGLLEHIGVIAARQSAVARDDHQQGALDLVPAQIGVAGTGVRRRDLGQ